MTIYIGTYTGRGSEGIYRAAFDPRTGALGNLALAAKLANPSFLARRGNRLVAACETGWAEGQTGSVAMLDIEKDGSLRPVSTVSSGGRGPCHVSLLADSAWVANYGNGVVARLPIVDGKLVEADFVDTHQGKGPHAKRQERTHAHCAVADPTGRFVVSADLGNDTLHVYSAIEPKLLMPIRVAGGAGPRLVSFSDDGRRMFLVHELTGEIASYDVDPASGTLRHRQTLSITPPGVVGEPSGAHVELHPGERFLFASERSSNTIATIALKSDGTLERVATTPAGGTTPRFFALSEDGRWMIVAHQSSGALQVFSVDGSRGALAPVGEPLAVASPSCVLVVP